MATRHQRLLDQDAMPLRKLRDAIKLLRVEGDRLLAKHTLTGRHRGLIHSTCAEFRQTDIDGVHSGVR